MVYAIQIDQTQALELAALSAGGGDITPGEMVDKFNEWLESEPEVVEPGKAQLMAALGVKP